MCKSLNNFKISKPFTSSLRQSRLLSRHILLKIKPLKNKRVKHKYSLGRNNSGSITVGHKGGGHKKLYRVVDFSREVDNGIVEGLEYDPNRTPWIHRVFHPDKLDHTYVLGVKDLKKGSPLCGFNELKINLGYNVTLKNLPEGFVIHNLSDNSKKRGQYLRSAGAFGMLLRKSQKHATIKLRSGEHRIFPLNAHASLGGVINEDLRFTNYGKAGRSRWYGLRPKVRGVAINPVDHPHGGGEGKTSGGRPSVTPWGKLTKGVPTTKTFNPLRLIIRKK